VESPALAAGSQGGYVMVSQGALIIVIWQLGHTFGVY